MASKVDICNMALAHIGSHDPIQDLDGETSTEAKACRRFYEPARRAALRDHTWGFATRYAALALNGDETAPDIWEHVYDYPSDCLKAREIMRAVATADPIPFEIAVAAAGNKRIIYSNEAEATLIYTADIDSAPVFDPLFVTAFSWRLAADIAPYITNDRQIQEAALTLYARGLETARAQDGNESVAAPARDAEWIRGRI